MAKASFPIKEFEKYLALDEKTLDKITMFGITIESVSKEEIELEILPNRPDLLSMHGFIRAIKAFENPKTKAKKYLVSHSKEYVVNVGKSVKDIRPFTVCAVVKNLKLSEQDLKEIISLQERLHSTMGRKRKKCAMGIYPLEKIKFPITYDARKPEDIKFIPLDYKKEMGAHQILQKHPAGKAYGSLLSKLEKFPVFADADKKILSMPPIINSEETGKVSSETSSVFIECSGYSLSTLSKALAIISTALADMGGKIYSVQVNDTEKFLSPDLRPEKIKISPENAGRIIGIQLSQTDLARLLEKMGHAYRKPFAYVPAWRTDILHEVDLIEEIAIAYGYNNLKPELPNISTSGQEAEENFLREKIGQILTGLGFLETSSYHLIKEEEAEKTRIKKPIQIESSKTEYKLLRPSLTIPILRTLSENKNAEYPQKLFETGTIFQRDDGSETGISERRSLVLAITPGNFTEAKQVLDYMMRMLNANYSLHEFEHEILIEGRAGKIVIEGREAGHVGEVHPSTLRNWKLKMPLAIVEIDLDEMQKIAYPK